MFSTIDSFESRFLKFYLIDKEEREHPIPSPDRFYRLVRSIRANPDQEKLSDLALKLLKVSPQSLRDDLEGDIGQDHRSIRVEVWRYVIDRENNQLKAVKWMEETKSEPAR